MEQDLSLGHDYLLWIALAAVAIRMAEAYLGDIVGFFKHRDLTVGGFAVTNVMWLVVVLSCAMVGWTAPIFSMLVPAFLLLSTLMHVIKTIKHHKWMPGLIGAIVLYIPIGVAIYIMADKDGVLTWASGLLGLLWAILVTFFPWCCMCCCGKHSKKKSH